MPDMIAFVEGDLVEALPTRVVVSVNGLGYLVHVPLSSFNQLPPVNHRVRLLTHLVVREDAHQLYGFLTAQERDLFLLLLQHVSGVGPKMALAVLSGMSVGSFKNAVARGEVAILARVKGVGKKTAERIVLELKDKLGVAAAWEAAAEGKTDERLTMHSWPCSRSVLNRWKPKKRYVRRRPLPRTRIRK